MYFFIIFIFNLLKLYICCDNFDGIPCNETISLIKDCNRPPLDTLVMFNHKIENDSFDYYNFEEYNVIKFNNTCFDVAGMKNVIESVKYVINYRVDDFYMNIIDDRFIFGGNTSDNKAINSVKLISAQLCDDDYKVCNMFLNMPESETVPEYKLKEEEPPLKILHCNDNNIIISDSNYEIIESDVKNCEKNMKNHVHELGAVMSPRPFEMDTESSIPIAFYDCFIEYNPYINLFANSAWEYCSDLEYIYMNVLHKMSWKRVALLSDYSEFNEVLEERLIEIFDENDILYGVEKCTEGKDLPKVLQKLAASDTRIIILNTDNRELTDAIFEHANLLNMLDREHVWITKNFIWTRNNIPKPLIINILLNYNYGEPFSLEQFHMSSRPRSRDVLRQTAHELLLATSKYGSEITIEAPEEHDILFAYISDMKECAITTDNFYKPCNDFELYLILGVILIFSVAFLVIFTFFMELDIRSSGCSRLT